MYLIGISGKKRSGKSTVADIIENLYVSTTISKIAFADALKEEVAEACGVSKEFIEENKSHFRLIMQGWGTDFRRQLYKDSYWVDKVLEKLCKLPNEIKVAIITDVRFINEADMIRKCGGYVIRIHRPGNQFIDSHLSETELDNYKFDDVITNDSTLEELKLRVIDTLFNHKLLVMK